MPAWHSDLKIKFAVTTPYSYSFFMYVLSDSFDGVGVVISGLFDSIVVITAFFH